MAEILGAVQKNAIGVGAALRRERAAKQPQEPNHDTVTSRLAK